MKILIKNGAVCFDNTIERTNLLIENSAVKDWGVADIMADQIIDASGCYVCPGFIDMHVHLDDQIGPFYLADSYRSGSQIAVQNGITTLFNFVTQKPGESLSQAIQAAGRKAAGKSYTDIGFHLTPTVFDETAWKDILSCLEMGYHTFKFYTTYKSAGIFLDYADIDWVMKKLKNRNIQFLFHSEDDPALHPFVPDRHELKTAYTHARLRPKNAEIIAIGKILELARDNVSKVHVVHASTPDGVEMIHRAKASIAATCETAPHYLYLNESQLRHDDGYKWICSPPLRSESDRLQLLQLALENKIDVFATDHCAFKKTDKSSSPDDIRNTPNGIAGLGALIPLIFNLNNDKLDAVILQMVQAMSENPAKITGCYPRKGVIAKGSDADIVILKSSDIQRPIRSSLSDVYETYEGFITRLEIKCVLLRGTAMTKNNQIIPGVQPQGKLLCPTQ